MKKNNKNLSVEEIKHLADLAKLSLTDKQIEKLQNQLTETINYVENLQELDTSKVKGLSQTTGLENVNFEDGKKNTRGLTVEQTLANTRKKKDDMFVVERIM